MVNDRDGTGPDVAANGAALVQIDTSPSGGFAYVHKVGNVGAKGTFLNGGGVTDAFTAMTVRTVGAVDTLLAIAAYGWHQGHAGENQRPLPG